MSSLTHLDPWHLEDHRLHGGLGEHQCCRYLHLAHVTLALREEGQALQPGAADELQTPWTPAAFEDSSTLIYLVWLKTLKTAALLKIGLLRDDLINVHPGVPLEDKNNP